MVNIWSEMIEEDLKDNRTFLLRRWRTAKQPRGSWHGYITSTSFDAFAATYAMQLAFELGFCCRSEV
eukprot:scaffold6148_cov140-Skeletonema_menzelii.AAC.7